jgi:oxidoreductase AflX
VIGFFEVGVSNMPLNPTQQHFALLGATGNTGRLVLKKLLQEASSGIEISIYVRSRSKLEGLFPSISRDTRVTIFEGDIKDETLIRDCLSGANIIICTVGENENIPNVSILRDCAEAVLTSLSSLRARTPIPSEWTPVRLLLLSSATWNPRFAADRPALLHWMIRNAFARPYSDLVKAQEMFLDAPELVNLLLVQPNALVKEPATGCVISTEFAYTAVSYEDLAQGFVHLATLPEYLKTTAIGVSSARAANPILYVPFVLGKVMRGLLFQFVPGYWRAEYAITRTLSGLLGKEKVE